MNLKEKLQIFSGDVLGGLNAAVITLPQALAFGVATGFGYLGSNNFMFCCGNIWY